MALTTRGGNKADFDPNKMVPKEIAGTFDTKEIFYAFGPGDVKQLATKEDFQADLNTLDANIARVETAALVAESLVVNKAGINDVTPTLTEAYSGAKTQELIDNITIADLSNKPVTFTQAATDTDIVSSDTLSILFGKILKRFATITTSLANKFNTSDIVQNDTTNDSTKVPSSAVTYQQGVEIDANTSAITTISNNKANKSTTISATMLATSWVGLVAPYTITLAITGATATNNIEIVPPSNITTEQVASMQSAQILTGTQLDNSITLMAFGTKPTIDLPITIIVRGDV